MLALIEKYSVQLNAFWLLIGTGLGVFGVTQIDSAQFATDASTLTSGLIVAVVNIFNFVQVIRKTI